MTESCRKRYSLRRKSARKRRWGRFKKLAALTAIAGLGYGAYKQFKPEGRAEKALSSHVDAPSPAVAAPSPAVKPQPSYDEQESKNIECLIDESGNIHSNINNAKLGRSINPEECKKI
jgi:hypothetical protein